MTVLMVARVWGAGGAVVGTDGEGNAEGGGKDGGEVATVNSIVVVTGGGHGDNDGTLVEQMVTGDSTDVGG